MKKYLSLIALCVFVSKTVLSQKTATLETKYFSFRSNSQLNAHLFLYNKAMICKFKKVPDDSLAWHSFKDKTKSIPSQDIIVLNSVLGFYRDSLLGKDLLFDSLMRDFSDKLIQTSPVFIKWQIAASEKINAFKPYFTKLFWPGIETENKTWLAVAKEQIMKLETTVVPELERIYEIKLPENKIVVDLTDYATWAGAYSYDDIFCHVIFSSSHYSNRGDLASEVIFHETSHFLVDKLVKEIKASVGGKDAKPSINLWHNMIFYTTGSVLEKVYGKEGKIFIPYYVQMKFEEKFPDFKTAVEACKLYWDVHMEGKSTMQESVKNIVSYVSEKK
jgi:hypothetical protein